MSAVLKPPGGAAAGSLAPGEGTNPFVGPNPILEKSKLFARDKERGDLVDLLIAERFVLLFGPTGAGKTSLVNAGLIPDIEKRRVRCLPVVKLEAAPLKEKDREKGTNPFLACLYQRLFEIKADDELPDNLENAFFEKLGEFEGRRVLIIIDTLEQIFTNVAQNEKSAIGFLRVLEILHSDYSNLLLLVAMREEFIGRLEGLARPVRPGGRLRIGPLRGDRAGEAIIKTSAGGNLSLDASCVAPIVRQLAEFAVVETKGDQLVSASDDNATWHASHNLTRKREEETKEAREAKQVPVEQLFVEPLYLQLTCFLNWEKLVDIARRYAADPAAASSADISVGDTIEAYVESVIVETATLHKNIVTERTLRSFLAEHMVASSGELDSVREEQARKDYGIQRPVLLTLDERKLIRREPRSGRDEFELSHFLIAKAVRRNYLNWCLTRLHPLQMRARRWARKHEEQFLLKKAEISEMRKWMASHPELVNDDDNKFAEASEKAWARRKSGGRRIVLMSGIVTFALIALLGLFGVSRLYRHSEEMHVFKNELDSTIKNLSMLRTDLEDRARIAARFGELGDLVSARPEGKHAIADIRKFIETNDPQGDPRDSMTFVTATYRKLAAAMSYKRIVMQNDAVEETLDELKRVRDTVTSRGAIADLASTRLLLGLAEQFAPQPLSGFEAVATRTPHGTIVAGAVAARAGIQVLAPATGPALVVRSRSPYARSPLSQQVFAESLDIMTDPTTFRVNAVFLAPQDSDNPTLFVRSARRDYIRIRQNAGAWLKPVYVQVQEAEDADVKASTIVANKEWGVCLVEVGGSYGRMTLMAGEVQKGKMCAKEVFVPPAGNGEPAIGHDADLLEVSRSGVFAFVGGANAPGTLFALDSQGRYAIPARFNDTPRYIVVAKFDDDDRRLALGDKNGTIFVFDLPSIVVDQGTMSMGRVTRIETYGGQATSLAFVGANQLVASTVGRELELIDLQSGRVSRLLSGFDVSPTFVIATNEETPQIAAGSPDNKLLYWSIDALNRNNPALDYSSAAAAPCGTNSKCAVKLDDVGTATSVSVAPDLEHVAVGLDDGRVLRISVKKRSPVGFYGPAKPQGLGPVTRLAFSPDGTKLAAAHSGGRIYAINVATHKSIDVATHNRLTGLAFIDDHTLASAGLDQRRGYFELSSDGGEIAVAEFHPATAPREDRAQQWNSLAFDPGSGSLIATQNSGATLFTRQQWREDMPPKTVIDQYKLDPPSDHILFSHRFGELLVDGGADGIQRVHTLRPLTPPPLKGASPESTPTTIIGGRRDWIARQYFDDTGTLMFAIDGNGTLRVTDTLHRRAIAAIDLPMARDVNTLDERKKLFSNDMHVACHTSTDSPVDRQSCVIATTLGVDQTRIGLLRLGM